MNGLIKTLIIGGVLLIVSILFCACTFTRVDVGFIGVKVKLAGSERGVQDMQLKSGWVWYNPLSEQVVEFPVSVQNIVLTKDPHEGNDAKDKQEATHGVDESIVFSSTEGMNVNADVGFSFHIDPQMAPHLYAKFKQNDMRVLAYGYMRNILRESFNEVGSQMPIQQIYGAGKNKLIEDATKKFQAKIGPDGIVIDQLTINAMRLPQNIADAINNAMAATQQAIQSENKVRQVKAEADQAVAAANGAAEAARQKAQGEADALLIKTKAEAESRILAADSQAKANKTINSTLTDQVLRYKSLDTRDGKLPVYNGGGAVPMIQVH